jgi:RHS repeat-associated protein
LLWAGQYQDPTTGLYYMRARWYDPSTGEFLSVDPAFNATLDAYGYADEDPLDGTDPSGLMLSAGGAGICQTVLACDASFLGVSYSDVTKASTKTLDAVLSTTNKDAAASGQALAQVIVASKIVNQAQAQEGSAYTSCQTEGHSSPACGFGLGSWKHDSTVVTQDRLALNHAESRTPCTPSKWLRLLGPADEPVQASLTL